MSIGLKISKQLQQTYYCESLSGKENSAERLIRWEVNAFVSAAFNFQLTLCGNLFFVTYHLSAGDSPWFHMHWP